MGFTFFTCVMLVIVVVFSDPVMGTERPSPNSDQTTILCSMHSESSSSDDGSLYEAGTLSIGDKVFDIVDEKDTMTIGNTKFKVFRRQ